MYVITIIFLILFIWGFFIEPNLLTVKCYKAENLCGQKIVFVSDFHIGKQDILRLRKIVQTINKLNPDCVLSGGDYIKGHSGKNSMSIDTIAEELAKINAPIITVLGNHDISYDKYSVKNAFEKRGIVVLDNSTTTINGISVAGVGDKHVSTSQIDSVLENVKGLSILLSHTPDIYYNVKQDVNLILAGHVHGGQVRIPIFGAIICPSKYGRKFSCGDFKETQNRMIVTRGLGTSILTMRFNDIPEIVILEEK